MLRTPVIEAPVLSDCVGRRVHLKLECLQRTGSFKIRGAAARMTALREEEHETGVVTCSSGNHGRAVAYVARRLGISARICVPRWIDPVKAEGMRRDGAEVDMSAATYDEADRRAMECAHREGRVFVHPFDDPWIIAGQGTLGLEIGEQVPNVETVAIPLSGGGLLTGAAAALRQGRAEPEVVAVSAQSAAVMWASLQAGAPIELPEEPTLASALSGGIGLDNAHTFELTKDLVDRHVLVSEEQIADAMRFAMLELGLVVEGGGAVGLAAACSGDLAGEGPLVIVLSGGNVDPATLQGLLETPAP